MLPLPGIGSVTGFSGQRKHSQAFFKFTSFTEPGAIYRCSAASCLVHSSVLMQIHTLTVGFKHMRVYSATPVSFLDSIACSKCQELSMVDQWTCSDCRFDADEPEREPQIFRRIKLNVDMSPDDFVTTQVPLPAARCSVMPVRRIGRHGHHEHVLTSCRNSTEARMARGSRCL